MAGLRVPRKRSQKTLRPLRGTYWQGDSQITNVRKFSKFIYLALKLYINTMISKDRHRMISSRKCITNFKLLSSKSAGHDYSNLDNIWAINEYWFLN